jgi:hypothetical protein
MLQELSQRIAGNEIPAILLALVFLFAYFMPVLVAVLRRHRYIGSIGAVTLALGWTGLGWLAAMIWAVNRDIRDAKPAQAEPAVPGETSLLEPSWSDIALGIEDGEPVPTTNCDHCDQPIKADALICQHCGRETRAAGGKETAAPAALDDENFKELYEALRDGDKGLAHDEQDTKLLDVINYARMLEEREWAARNESGRSAVNEVREPCGLAEFEIVRRTGTGPGG